MAAHKIKILNMQKNSQNAVKNHKNISIAIGSLIAPQTPILS